MEAFGIQLHAIRSWLPHASRDDDTIEGEGEGVNCRLLCRAGCANAVDEGSISTEPPRWVTRMPVADPDLAGVVWGEAVSFLAIPIH